MLKHLKKSMKSRENQQLLACLFDSYCNSNSHTNHGVVTCTERASNARGISKKKPSPNLLLVSFNPFLFVPLWTQCGRVCFCPRIYDTIFTLFCQWISSNKNPKEGKELSGTCAPLGFICDFDRYKEFRNDI